jgi:hypothetical protein
MDWPRRLEKCPNRLQCGSMLRDYPTQCACFKAGTLLQTAVKRDDSCVMQVYKDIPSTLTCVSCSVFWLDDKMSDHGLRGDPIA